MGKVKVSEDDIIEKLQEENRPFPLAELSDYFSATRTTVRKKISRARHNGHPIIPTSDGNWYLVKIENGKQLRAVFDAIEWEAKVSNGLRQVRKIAQETKATATKGAIKEYEKELIE